MNKYYLSISKEYFDKECKNLLNHIVKKEEEYRLSIMYEQEFEMEEFIYDSCSLFFDNYRYLLGTLIAYYAREHCKIEDIVYLNNHINDYDLGNLDLVCVLKKIGIDVDSSEFVTQVLNSIESYIKKYDNEKSR